MPYEKEKDKTVWESDSVDGNTNSVLTVQIKQYNGSDPKVQIARFGITDDPNEEPRFRKLGRLNAAELEGILPKLQEAAEQIRKMEGGDED